jgi:hypothetical protein
MYKKMTTDLLTAYDLIWESKYTTVILGVGTQIDEGVTELVIDYVEISKSKIPLRDKEVFGVSDDCITLSDFISDVYYPQRQAPDDSCVKDVNKTLGKWWVNNQLFKIVSIEEYLNWKSEQRNNTIDTIIE